jgi:Transcription-silencing protein, cryptic loci regulator Clr2
LLCRHCCQKFGVGNGSALKVVLLKSILLQPHLPHHPLRLSNSCLFTGVNYYLDSLPDGYALFETDRPAGDGQAYKRLFGHPTGRYYDSAKRFEVHFKWLMHSMEGDCECVLCSGKKPPAVRRSDVFRLDQRILSRPESRTHSREAALTQREDSSTLHFWLIHTLKLTEECLGLRSKSATGLASERGKFGS